MVYQIYYQETENSKRMVLFDVEMYVKKNELHKGNDDKWYVEMHSDSFISGAVDFIVKASVEGTTDLSSFVSDCKELEELRGWLWKTHSNKPRTMEMAAVDNAVWNDYVKRKVYRFAEKYGLYVNED